MKDYWFGCPLDIDELITKKYKDYLDVKFNETLDLELELEDKIILSRIILFDQIPRHIYRNNKDEIKKYDLKARLILEKSGILDKLELLTEEERCFALLPWRHTFEEDKLIKCLKLVIEWREEKPNNAMYRRFYQATIKALSTINNKKDLLYKTTNKNYFSILDKKVIHIMNDTDTSSLSNNYLLKTFRDNIKPLIDKLDQENILISVSGGVDSIVCLFLAKYAFPEKTVKAISINYANRQEQYLEIDMVNNFCQKLDIPHYVREITEIKRTRDSDREFYESITREIRFDSYKSLNGLVVLGHNLDDSLENIFSNIKKKQNYDNLFGMDLYSKEKDVNIARPLLKISKKQIIEFANQFYIPYTCDSTPSWSERGKLRDELIPFINNFDPSILLGLIELTNNYKEIYKIYNGILPLIEYNENNCLVTNKNIYILDYWKKIFTKIALHYNVEFIKNKALIHMIEQLKNNSLHRITLSKNMICQLDINTNNLLVLIN
jgi:tRNA(Ile)-lysidine synthetase-like protein